MNFNFACRKCLLIDESNFSRFFLRCCKCEYNVVYIKNIEISLSFENKQNSSKIKFNLNLIYLSINIRNHNKDDFFWLYNTRNNFRFFLNCLYSFDIWQYIFSLLKIFKKIFTMFNYLILKWKLTTKIIIMRNIFNANVAIYTF
jgi:hypothetical protein